MIRYSMSVKVRISYQEPQELHTVLKMLNPVITSYKVEKRQNGAYKRAYAEISIPEGKVQKCANSPLI